MRVHRILLTPLATGRTSLRGEQARYLSRVLRVRPGASVLAFDGRGMEAEGVVAAVDDQQVEITLGPSRRATSEASVRLTIAVALLKGDRLTGVVRQGTELGVVRFCPFVSRYCDARALSSARLERLRKVAAEAARQSGRSVVPEVEEPRPLTDLAWTGLALVAHPRAERTMNDALAERAAPATEITLLSGPEGGFDDAELERLVEAGATPIRLGARTLRAETAPLALAAALLIPEAR